MLTFCILSRRRGVETGSACGLKLLLHEDLSLAVFTLIQTLREGMSKSCDLSRSLASGTTCFRELNL